MTVRADGRYGELLRLTPARAGWAGIALGALAFWLALPPVALRTIVPSAVVAALAAACGAWALREGLRRLGIGAIVSAIIGIGGALAATHAGLGNLEVVVVWSALCASMLANATPLTFAAIGGLVSERSGVVNIGLEGQMLSGAFFGIWGADVTGSWVGGIAIAMLSGAVLGLIHAVFSIHLRADQVVGGVGINLLALGVTGYFFIQIYGSAGTPSDVPAIPDVSIPGFRDVYFFGPAFGDLNLMVWASLALVILAWLVLFRTPLGLRLRSVGEKPEAADTAGISVYSMRYGAVVMSGVLAALGGAYLSIGFVHSFNQNMTVGRGFIALAALNFGNWRPFGALWATLLFGFSSALALRLPTFSAQAGTLFQALPYVLTLVAVAGIIGRTRPPAASGIPYVKG